MSETYYDRHRDSGSKIAYDGELIDLQDGVYRAKADRARERMYAYEEEKVEDLQMTWTDVEEELKEG